MSNIYAIEAKEGFYEGFYGIVWYVVDEFENFSDAKECAKDLSYELMQDYNIAEKAGWTDEAIERGLEYDSEDYWNFINDCAADNLDYTIYHINNIDNFSIEELDKKFNENPEDFISKYCKTLAF